MKKEALRVSTTIPAAPTTLYYAWLNSDEHSQMTGAPAKLDGNVGGKFTAWNGYISGKLVILDLGRRLVMSWRTTDFPRDAHDSRVEIHLEALGGSTRVTLLHTEIPEGQAEQYRSGWSEKYFEPMRAFFTKFLPDPRNPPPPRRPQPPPDEDEDESEDSTPSKKPPSKPLKKKGAAPVKIMPARRRRRPRSAGAEDPSRRRPQKPAPEPKKAPKPEPKKAAEKPAKTGKPEKKADKAGVKKADKKPVKEGRQEARQGGQAQEEEVTLRARQPAIRCARDRARSPSRPPRISRRIPDAVPRRRERHHAPRESGVQSDRGGRRLGRLSRPAAT